MSDLIVFHFLDQSFSVLTHDDGEPWFIAKEVCDILDLKNVSNAVGRLDQDEKGVLSTDNALIVNEFGFYSLVLKSRKKAAKAFQRMVTHEVLPQIRKTGKYAPSAPQVKNPANQLMIDAIVRIDTLEQDIARQDAVQQAQQAAIIASQAKAIEALQHAQRAEQKADVAFDNQNFWTVAEYVQYHGLWHQCPSASYADASRHMQQYCRRERLNYRNPAVLPRRIPVGDKNWETELGYHTSIFEAAFLPWLLRLQSQGHLHILSQTESGNL